MLYWQANFQIPNSGTQASEVFVVAEKTDQSVTAKFYADKALVSLLFEKTYPATAQDVYTYLLSLEEFAPYSIYTQ